MSSEGGVSWAVGWLKKWMDYYRDLGGGFEEEELIVSEKDAQEALAGEAVATVVALYIYPIKSCGRISLTRASLEPTGLRWDRQWMVVRENGRPLTQRIAPKMCQIEISLPEEVLYGKVRKPPRHAVMILKAPGMEELKVPLTPSKPYAIMEPVNIWGWVGPALDEGTVAAEWLTKYLELPSRLVRFDLDNAVRETDPRHASGHKTAFADALPMLLLSQASLDALNARLAKPVDIDRFRPNIVVDGCEEFAEDFWKTFQIGRLTFHGVSLCPRCKQTTVDKETLMFEPEPLSTLRTFRAGRYLTSEHRVRNSVRYHKRELLQSFIALVCLY
ncbi:hypothetical protein O6H91_21G052300 [Diphasiastrum complanatum]|uniref:Uncharacterized protein n=1 Tax=Diphasiastrum complanatum TaxID=34168 RepID=A0ACC2AKI3_DIPCM|nr:hypothetical protein O6H91_21G052300 [Diphasiastrum complanatum]